MDIKKKIREVKAVSRKTGKKTISHTVWYGKYQIRVQVYIPTGRTSWNWDGKYIPGIVITDVWGKRRFIPRYFSDQTNMDKYFVRQRTPCTYNNFYYDELQEVA